MRGFFKKIVYPTLTLCVRILSRTLTSLEVVGLERVPRAGPVILVCNHAHLVDPPLIGSFAPRRVHAMAKRELFETPLIGWIFWAVGAFPVRRYSGDLGALRTARNYLRNNSVLLMYPEGTRNHGRGLKPALPGAAMVAQFTNTQIVPVAIEGSHSIRWRSLPFLWLIGRAPSIRIEFGQPFTLEDKRATTQNTLADTDRMMREIAALLPADQRGCYGDQTAGTIVTARATSDESEYLNNNQPKDRE